MFFVAGSGLMLALPEAVSRVSDYARFLAMRYKKKLERLEEKRIVIDLRTMRPSEKQKVVDAVRQKFEAHKAKQNDWKPADLTEAWIKDGHRDESYQEFVARQLRKMTLSEERDSEPPVDPTTHPLIQILADKVKP